jgi:hypothetical protein
MSNIEHRISNVELKIHLDCLIKTINMTYVGTIALAGP